MKILLVMDPGILIPVKGYGGIERIIEMLALEYVRKGHEVHLLITKGSILEGCTVHGFGKEGFPPNKWDARKAIPKVWKFLRKHKNDFDLVHNFGRLIYLLPLLNHPVKKIMSYQREITSRNIKWVNALANQNLIFTGCSQNLINRIEIAGEWEAVYNACDFTKYQLISDIAHDAPLIFLGRIEKIKGCHTAISVAKATGNRLVIAGNISTLPEEKAYYENEVAPHIDGKQIQYVGAVNDVQKNEWLGKSKALLFPIEWDEPFGIVMVEAMACGTPVIAFNCGSVNEVVDEGITGFKINTKDEMIASVKKISTLSRSRCRQHAITRFDVRIIAEQYIDIIENNRKKIVILSTHQPAGNPRALKEYITLKEMGYKVKILYGYNADWSNRIDEEKFFKGDLPRQELVEVGGNPNNYPLQYFLSRVVYRIFKTLYFFKPFKNFSFNRVTINLWAKVKQYPADIYIAHYLGALPAALRAGTKMNVPVVFDAEDFHRGEGSYYNEQMHDVVALENELLPKVNAMTTASPLISAEYKKYYPNQNIITINNVFSKQYLQPFFRTEQTNFKLFWFSQYIGEGRGLEVFIEALNFFSEAPITLTIMGNIISKVYIEQLLNLSHNRAKIFFLETVPPEEIFSIAAGYDIGLAGEISNFKNKELCLSNKIFTYLMAGNCVLASDMRGQAAFMDQHPGIGFTYKHDDPEDLAKKIKMLYENRVLLETCKQHARQIAEEQLNWEAEKEPWMNLINELLYKEDNKQTMFDASNGFTKSKS